MEIKIQEGLEGPRIITVEDTTSGGNGNGVFTGNKVVSWAKLARISGL